MIVTSGRLAIVNPMFDQFLYFDKLTEYAINPTFRTELDHRKYRFYISMIITYFFRGCIILFQIKIILNSGALNPDISIDCARKALVFLLRHFH